MTPYEEQISKVEAILDDGIPPHRDVDTKALASSIVSAMADDWGYAINADGSRTALMSPAFSIPEAQREYVDTGHSDIVMWTRKPGD